MTPDEAQAGEIADQPAREGGVATARRTVSQAALERYGRRMRRGRAIYYSVIAVVVLALGVSVIVIWSHGETAHTTLHTAAAPAPSVAAQTPSTTQRQAWQTTDRTAIGTPYWRGTVVTFGAHSVRGRNAATGRVTWSYTRTDRTVCQAVQDNGVTVAVYELHGTCDQLTGLDSGTGERKWTRTLDKDGQPLHGHPSYAVTQAAIMFTTPSVIYTIDPSSGLDRWVYHPDGCSIGNTAIGALNALISQTCTHQACAGRTFCGPGPQLLLRAADAGRDDNDKANPDKIKWNLIGTNAIPASADQLISAVDTRSGQLRVLDVTKGKTLYRLRLTPRLASTAANTAAITALATARAELLWIAGTTYSVELTGAAFFWTTPTPGPPTVTPLPGTSVDPPDLSTSTVVLTAPGGITLLSPGTGKPIQTFAASNPPAASLAYPLGSGFVVAGGSTTVYR